MARLTNVLFILILTVFAEAQAAGFDQTPLEKQIDRASIDIDQSSMAREILAARELERRGATVLRGSGWGTLSTDDRWKIVFKLAVEDKRREEIRLLWAASRAPRSDAKLTPIQRDYIEKLWIEIAGQNQPFPELREQTREALKELARRAPALWTTNWRDYPGMYGENDERLESRLDVLAELFGRTLGLARQARQEGDVMTAREAALDALRVLTEVYLLVGSTLGDRREQCERTGAYGMVAGAVTLGPSLLGMACSVGSPMMIASTLAASFSGLVTYVGFTNSSREYRGAPPLMMPKRLKRFYQRRSAQKALWHFWNFSVLYGASIPELADLSASEDPFELGWSSPHVRMERAKEWSIKEIWSSLGDDDPSEFCEALLGLTGKTGFAITSRQ